MKTLKDLGETKWYRFLKVLYFLIFLTSLSAFLLIGIDWWTHYYELTRGDREGLLFFLQILVLTESIRRIFYYIYFGKIFPK